MQPFSRTTRCLLLGVSNLLVKCIGALIDPLVRPVAGWFAAMMFSCAALLVIGTAFTMTLRGAVTWATFVPLFLIYVSSMSATLWCSNTGDFGFEICGNIGVVFCVLVYYSALPLDDYAPMTAAEEDEFDPRVTRVRAP